MVHPTCSLCGEMKRTKDMHSKNKSIFTDEYHCVFGGQKDEGPLCNQCYNVFLTLKKGHNLVSLSC